MREANKEYGWDLNFGAIAEIFRGGCIIRAAFLQKITEAFDKNSSLENLLLDDYFKQAIDSAESNWRLVISQSCINRNPGTDFQFCSRLLRQLSQCSPSTKSSSSTTRLFWRSYL